MSYYITYPGFPTFLVITELPARDSGEPDSVISIYQAPEAVTRFFRMVNRVLVWSKPPKSATVYRSTDTVLAPGSFVPIWQGSIKDFPGMTAQGEIKKPKGENNVKAEDSTAIH